MCVRQSGGCRGDHRIACPWTDEIIGAHALGGSDLHDERAALAACDPKKVGAVVEDRTTAGAMHGAPGGGPMVPERGLLLAI